MVTLIDSGSLVKAKLQSTRSGNIIQPLCKLYQWRVRISWIKSGDSAGVDGDIIGLGLSINPLGPRELQQIRRVCGVVTADLWSAPSRTSNSCGCEQLCKRFVIIWISLVCWSVPYFITSWWRGGLRSSRPTSDFKVKRFLAEVQNAKGSERLQSHNRLWDYSPQKLNQPFRSVSR